MARLSACTADPEKSVVSDGEDTEESSATEVTRSSENECQRSDKEPEPLDSSTSKEDKVRIVLTSDVVTTPLCAH